MDGLPDIMEADRLRLRRAKPADAEVLFALLNNWNVVKWLARPSWPNEITRTKEYLAKANQGPLSEQYWVIETPEYVLGGIAVGIEPASSHQSDPGPHIGYWLGEPHWGRGHMTRAATLLCAAIFQHTDEPAIFSGLFEGNEGSWRVQQKLGFVIEGRSELFSTPLGKVMPHISTRLARSDFRPAL